MNAFEKAADWLEHGRPGELSAAAEAARFGERIWGGAPGVRCYARTDADAFRLALVGGPRGGTLVYEVLGGEGGWFR